MALRYKARAKGVSRVDMLCYERDLGSEVPVVQAKVPVELAVLTDPSQAVALGESRLWDGFEERAWRRRSPERLRRRVAERTEDFRARLAEGEMVVTAIKDGEYLGAAWFCLGGRKGDPVVESYVELGPKQALLYQSQVDRSWRGNRIYGSMISAGLRRLQEQGFQKVVAHVEDDNAPSIAAVESVGFRPVRLIRFRRLFTSVRRQEQRLDRAD